MRLPSTRACRWAFTLIEMLVVVALILILLTIAAAMFPRFAENQRIVKGADQISQTLLIAKQRALRDRKPTGIRFMVDQQNRVTELVYVQQLDDFAVGHYTQGAQNPDPVNGYLCMFTAAVDFTGGGASNLEAPDQAPVTAGDHIEFLGGGLVHEIWWVSNRSQLYIAPWSSRPPQVSAPLPTSGPNYRIIRQPRRISGERPLQLPQNIAIEGSLSQNVPMRRVYYGNPAGYTPSNPDSRTNVKFFEVLFEPGGRVAGKGTASGDNIILWVWDTTKTTPQEGSPLLVSIHTRTGMIAVHPVNPPPGDPYLFTKDGRSSGL